MSCQFSLAFWSPNSAENTKSYINLGLLFVECAEEHPDVNAIQKQWMQEVEVSIIDVQGQFVCITEM